MGGFKVSAVEEITVHLPRALMRQVRARASATGQNEYIVEAIRCYIEMRRLSDLRQRLIAGYKANAEADAALAAEWEPLGREA